VVVARFVSWPRAIAIVTERWQRSAHSLVFLPRQMGFSGGVSDALRAQPSASAPRRDQGWPPCQREDVRADLSWRWPRRLDLRRANRFQGRGRDDRTVGRRRDPAATLSGSTEVPEGRTAPVRDSRRALGRAPERARSEIAFAIREHQCLSFSVPDSAATKS